HLRTLRLAIALGLHAGSRGPQAQRVATSLEPRARRLACRARRLVPGLATHRPPATRHPAPGAAPPHRPTDRSRRPSPRAVPRGERTPRPTHRHRPPGRDRHTARGGPPVTVRSTPHPSLRPRAARRETRLPRVCERV